MTQEISNAQDIIDVRDVIARIEELEKEVGEEADEQNAEAAEELKILTALMDDLKGNGGNEQWRGDWYPLTLVNESYFAEYAEQLAEDIGAINKQAQWPLRHIDWDAASEELKGDYYEADFDGATFYCQ